jgi:F-type H+-transporting ATPase subunit delta
MDQGRVCMSYARALLDWAEESGLAKNIYIESAHLIQLIEENPSFYYLLHTPMVSLTKKTKAVTTILLNYAPNLTNIVCLTIKNRREKQLKHILYCFQKLFRDKNGIIKTHVEVATEIGKNTQVIIKEYIAKTLKKNVEIDFSVNPMIIGGFNLVIEDRLLDKSVRGELELLRKRLN